MEMTVEQARQFLEEKGYYVDNLWTVRDVTDKYECSDEVAQEILNSAVSNDWIIEQIHLTIEDLATDKELKEKDE